ncbi:ribosome small subunit-dependent GTPase A [Alkalicella caledoniensis]|uniref:Small ribosomal subunit biogenesis GTPase RsgA n=1 Tax=Alkalicella caledoniensis TaxID=2731377 RepID=A0A7G9W796_ALKCA|nr:ribosome small subunit-dependent GTPase A [Alkalicella caledoniensis]QNO14558.1 ribosome small subunit-dependent GTPase A [Alkalicella caledoniensis]
MNLTNYGWNEKWEDNFLNLNQREKLVPARVSAVYSERYDIFTTEGEKQAKMSGKMIYESLYAAKNPAVGDWVAVENNPNGPWIIKGVLPRQSCLQRQGINGEVESQVIGSNVDKCILVQSLLGDYSIARLERYVAMVWDSGSIPMIVLTKADLLEEEEVIDKIGEVESAFPGVDIMAISSITKKGIDKLMPLLEPTKTYMVMGSSGVGKSTLLNVLMGEEIMETADVREADQKGRHTTTHRQMFTLENGALYIDTPGMRELALFNFQGLNKTFSDVAEIARTCKFNNCTHEDEPDCAVREALESGSLTVERWESYIKLKKEERVYKSKQIRLQKKIANAKVKKQKVHYKDFKRGKTGKIEYQY